MKYKTNKMLPKCIPTSYSEDCDMQDTDGVQLILKQITSNECHLYLDEPIGLPSYYRNLMHYFHTMQETDSLMVWIDTPGGSLDGALAIIDGMQSTEGDVQVIVTGEASSAGSLIALNAPSLVIGNRARFMLHSASYSVGHSKQGDIESHVESNKVSIRKIMQETYEGFLTEQEIELLFIGKDYYFDAGEIMKRLAARDEYQLGKNVMPEEDTEEIEPCVELKSNKIYALSDAERHAFFDEAVKSKPKPKKAK